MNRLLPFVFFLIFSPGAAQASAFINDSLVKDLDCSTLSRGTVLRYVRPEAFSADNHIPVSNWWGKNNLGQCWALSLTQREYFYLVRLADPGARDIRESGELENAMNLAAGKVFRKNCKGNDASRCYSSQETPMKVFSVPDRDIADSRFKSGAFMEELTRGFNRPKRNFENAIEMRQSDRFFRRGNLDLIDAPRDRTPQENEAAMAQIEQDLGQGKMPLLIVRIAKTNLHVVLGKSLEKLADGRYRIALYDSNQPRLEPVLEYKDKEFYAPEVLNRIGVDDPVSPIGIFVRDEDKMDKIQDALFAHYQDLCK
jgi:hypothetical protein